jgi:hypothetical protein
LKKKNKKPNWANSSAHFGSAQLSGPLASAPALAFARNRAAQHRGLLARALSLSFFR